MAQEAPCKFLEWDSDFFGLRIGRVTENQLQPEIIEQINQWAEVQRIDCLYFLAEIGDLNTIRQAESNEFRLVDIRVTLEKIIDQSIPIPQPDSIGSIRLVGPDDLNALKAIARVSYHDTRFHTDTNFPVSRADALYEIWIEKSCKGFADAVFVMDIDNQPVGYISCHLLGEGKGNIGLVGVSQDSRGKSIGRLLIDSALNWLVGKNVTQVSVVTQGRNIKAQRLYQRRGFLTRSLQFWYHRWFINR
jgi:dTDP-4-amino-4,6-dideoxy-D-galactose acyltransferase